MTVYEVLIKEGKQPSCKPSNPCCEEPCDEPSFWDLLPQCRLNWIALGLAAFAIGFGLIGLGYINIGTATIVANETNASTILVTFDPTYLTQGTRLISIFLGIIGVFAWILFKACSDDWKTVVVGSLVGASGFPLAAIGLVYSTVSQFHNIPPTIPPFDPTWFNIAVPLIIAGIVGFLFLAYLIYSSHYYGCIAAKKAIIVSLIFLSAGWAAWSLGRLLNAAIITFQYSTSITFPPLSGYVFPSTAFMAFIAVSIINIVLVVALGWYVLGCVADNCFTTFLPLFASAAPLGNWALYRVGLNVLSYTGTFTSLPPFPTTPAPPLTQFAYAIGIVSITALLLTFVIASGAGDTFVITAASASPLLYAIATYTYVATASNLTGAIPPDFVTSILRGTFSGIALTAVLGFFLRCKAQCPIPKVIYGLASGIFGWAVIYLYSTYSADILDETFPNTTLATLNIGLNVIVGVAVLAVLYVQFIACDELLSAITFTNIALLTVGAAGFTGTIAYYQAGRGESATALNPPDIRAATMIYIAYALTALFLPLLFVKCGGIKRQVVIAIASLAFGVAAIDFGRAVAFARAVAFSANNVNRTNSTSSLTYIFSAFGAVLAGQAIVWSYSQASVCTALIATFTGLVADGIALQIIILVDTLNFGFTAPNLALIGTPWLVFTLALVALLVFLEFKSLCIPQLCRFSLGLLIPVLGIAVCGKFFGASAILGATSSRISIPLGYLLATSYTSRLILVNSIVPLACLFVSLQAFKCTSRLAYLPSSIAYSAVVYVASQFQLPDINTILSTSRVNGGLAALPPFSNVLTAIYYYFDLTVSDPTTISDNVTFITQVSLVYNLFLALALITGFAFSCSRPVSAAIIGASIAAAAISFGAFGIANVVSGVFRGAAAPLSGNITDITTFITFANFLTGISSQLVLLAVGVLTVLFISFDKCSYRSC